MDKAEEYCNYFKSMLNKSNIKFYIYDNDSIKLISIPLLNKKNGKLITNTNNAIFLITISPIGFINFSISDLCFVRGNNIQKGLTALYEFNENTTDSIKCCFDSKNYLQIEYYNKFTTAEKGYDCFCSLMDKYYNEEFIGRFIDIEGINET